MIRDKIDLKNKKIVVIYMLYFGDMVSLTPFLEVLRREAEGSEISLVVDSRFVDSVRYNPNVDHIIPADRAHMGMKATWNLGKKIGRQRPDILLVLHGTSRTSLTALAMKPKFWTGEAGTRFDRFFMDRILLVERKDCHAAEKYLRRVTWAWKTRRIMACRRLRPGNGKKRRLNFSANTASMIDRITCSACLSAVPWKRKTGRRPVSAGRRIISRRRAIGRCFSV